MHLPLSLWCRMRSGSSRALGPDEDTKSGIDFIIRTIGQHSGKDTVCKAASDDETSDAGNDSDAGALTCESQAPMVPTAPAVIDLEALDIATLTFKQLRAVVGAQVAEYTNAIFQHSSRMTKVANFRPASTLLTLATPSGARQPFRKGQLDPSVFYHAIMAAVETSNKPIAATDAFVNFTGGAPESLVGAIAAGFRTIFHVCSSPDEVLMMQLPGEEMEQNVNYMQYVSPKFLPCSISKQACVVISEHGIGAYAALGISALTYLGLRCPTLASLLPRQCASCLNWS